MNFDMLKNMVGDMDPEQTAELARQMDIAGFIEKMIPVLYEELEPHFDDIKFEAQSEDFDEAREYFESLDDDEQYDILIETISDVTTTLRLCRERPQDGFPMLKERIRNPDTLEPLLFIFDDNENIDDPKGFARNVITLAGVNMIPEAYTEIERSTIESRFKGE